MIPPVNAMTIMNGVGEKDEHDDDENEVVPDLMKPLLNRDESESDTCRGGGGGSMADESERPSLLRTWVGSRRRSSTASASTSTSTSAAARLSITSTLSSTRTSTATATATTATATSGPLSQQAPSTPQTPKDQAQTQASANRTTRIADALRFTTTTTKTQKQLNSSSSSASGGTTPEEDLDAVGQFLRQGTLAAWGIWFVLMFVTFRFTPPESLEVIEGNELKSTWMMVILLFVTNGSRILPLAFQNNGFAFVHSGILTGALSIQFMAVLSNLILAILPTPILIDPITGMRIHLVRYAAWVPLAFLMTFLTEAIDIPLSPHHGRVAWCYAIALGLSTFAGWIFPFCHNLMAWRCVLAVAWILFMSLFWRLYHRYYRYQQLKQQQTRVLLQTKQRRRTSPSSRPINVLNEQVDRAHFSLQLVLLCAISWTAIALNFTLEAFLPQYLLPDSFWLKAEIPLISGHVLEAISKIWYLSLQLNVYDKIFDESNRAIRRLEELRTLMSALWEASSDIMVICARTEHTIHAVISPSSLLQYQQPVNHHHNHNNQHRHSNRRRNDTAIMDDNSNMNNMESLSIMLEIVPHLGTFCSFPVDLSKPVTRVDAHSIQQARESSRKHFGKLDGYPHLLTGTAVEKNLTTIAHLALQVSENLLVATPADDDDDHHRHSDEQQLEASSSHSQLNNNNHNNVTATEESWVLQELYAPSSDLGATNQNNDRVKCEAKVTPIDAGALLLVLRDVSERYQRFEIEKQLLEEVIVRKKDAEAIRFTRHEVKNGLLAAIGIVDSCREAYEKQRAQLLELQKWKEEHLAKLGGAAANDENSANVAGRDDATTTITTTITSSALPSNPPPPPARESMSSTSSTKDDLQTHMNDLDATLRQVLESILDNAMIREVLFEGYVPRRESVDLPDLLQTSQRLRRSSIAEEAAADQKSSTRKFPLKVNPDRFPHLNIDPQLVRNIYQHAISNACKYGKVDGDVTTSLKYDKTAERFTMEIFNLPGYRHENLIDLTQEEIDCVFIEGTQLRANQCLETDEGKLASARSAGDGAWIMMKAAQCLGGTCSIHFDSPGTTFTFECPAKVCEAWKAKHQSQQHGAAGTNCKVGGEFAFPEDTWAVAVEDSAMQRKLLDRFLKKAGIAQDRCVALGKDAQEILNFTERIRELLQQNPTSKFLCVIDENLDIVEGGAVTKTVSGSFGIQKLLGSLHARDESRVLALIRSANDSVQEVELYQARAHGFLLKGPMKKGGLLEEIKPWWIRRFMSRPSIRNLDGSGVLRPVRRPSSSNLLEDSFSTNEEDEMGPARERIIDLVKEVDVLCDVDDQTCASSVSSNEDDSSAEDMMSNDAMVAPAVSSIPLLPPPPTRLVRRTSRFVDWQSVRYRMMLLNVDLKTHLILDNFALAAKAIDEITNSSDSGFRPQDLQNRWLEIRDLILKEVTSSGVGRVRLAEKFSVQTKP